MFARSVNEERSSVRHSLVYKDVLSYFVLGRSAVNFFRRSVFRDDQSVDCTEETVEELRKSAPLFFFMLVLLSRSIVMFLILVLETIVDVDCIFPELVSLFSFR